MTDAQKIESAYRSIEGYFGEEYRDAIDLPVELARQEVNSWLFHEWENPPIDSWEFDIAFARFQKFAAS